MRLILLVLAVAMFSGCTTMGYALKGMGDGLQAGAKAGEPSKTYNCTTFDQGNNYTCN